MLYDVPIKTEGRSLNQKEIARKTGAIAVANHKPGSDEWLAMRQLGIGGSDVAAILGWSPFTSFYTLWANKTGLVEADKLDNPAIEWGHRLESVVMDKFQDEHPELKVIRDVGTWTRLGLEFMLANPDGLVVEEDGSLSILEIKTAGRADAWADGVPMAYIAQVQHYMITLGLKKAYVAVLIGGRDYREYIVEADQFGQDVIIDQIKAFLHYVETKTPPEFDGSQSTYETVRKIHPEISDESVEIDPNYAIRYLGASRNYETASESLNVIKTTIIAEMGNAKTATVGGEVLFARQARGNGTPFLVYKGGK